MDIEQAKSMLDDVDNNGSGLTDWEIDFIDSLLKQTDRGIPLTERQEFYLKRIHKDRYIKA